MVLQVLNALQSAEKKTSRGNSLAAGLHLMGLPKAVIAEEIRFAYFNCNRFTLVVTQYRHT
jgi:hypothetical protein